jgi:hypothetical protein
VNSAAVWAVRAKILLAGFTTDASACWCLYAAPSEKNSVSSGPFFSDPSGTRLTFFSDTRAIGQVKIIIDCVSC